MRIGVDGACWANRRGYGRHARALLAAALEVDRRNHYVFFVDSEQAATELPAGGDVVRVRASMPAVEAASSEGRRSLADLWAMSRAMSDPSLDCLLFPSVYSYVPVFSRACKIVAIHDVIPEKFPQYVFPTAASRRNWKMKSWLARHQADLILTVSGFSRRSIIEWFGEAPGRVWVVGEASDPAFRVLENPAFSDRLRGLGITPQHRVLVFVGGFSPHKNLARLLDAFATLATKHNDLRLVLVGDYETDAFYSCYPEIRARAAEASLDGLVIFTGYLPDGELALLLNLSTALVLPSYLEGYGLPAIEAAACGLPVVATKASPLPELLGAGGLYVDPEDTTGLLRAIERIVTDPVLARSLGEEGLRAAAALSWKRAAVELLAVFDQVAERHAKAA